MYANPVSTPHTYESRVARPSVMAGSERSERHQQKKVAHIAVSAIDVTGNNILYVIDTVNPHIAVYQANGGTSGTQGISLVAARDISLDLQLEGLNDKSEFQYEDLYRTFVENGLEIAHMNTLYMSAPSRRSLLSGYVSM